MRSSFKYLRKWNTNLEKWQGIMLLGLLTCIWFPFKSVSNPIWKNQGKKSQSTVVGRISSAVSFNVCLYLRNNILVSKL